MGDLIKGNLGTVGTYDVAWSGGKLALNITAGDQMVAGNFGVSVSARPVIDALFAKLPQNLITQEIQAAIDAAIEAS